MRALDQTRIELLEVATNSTEALSTAPMLEMGREGGNQNTALPDPGGNAAQGKEASQADGLAQEGPGDPDRPALHGAGIRAGTKNQVRHTELGAMLATGEGQQKIAFGAALGEPQPGNPSHQAQNSDTAGRLGPNGPTDYEDRD